ncbi:MAG: histidine kinase N-terminal 7TM domain-containing protein [Haloarculaceae archaeon]
MSTLTPIQVILLGAIAIGAAGALLAWRERPEPGARPLALLLFAQCWWSATLFFRIEAVGLPAKSFWLNVSWVGVPLIPVAWLFFSLEYTGHSEYVQPRYIALALVIPAITALLALSNDYHDLLHVNMRLAERAGEVQLVRTFGVWYWIIAGYTYLLGLLGAVPLLEFIKSEIHVFRGQSLAILVGLLAPWVTNILFLLGSLPTGAVDPTPIAFAVSGVAYLGALTRFELFGTSPTPIRPARRSVFDRMRGGVIVLDRYRNIVDMNEQAAAAIEMPPADALGRSVETVIPQLETSNEQRVQSGQTILRPEETNRVYDISTKEVTDTHDRRIGHIVTLTDISDYLRQQQRLEVLNRVFRHNIRTNIQVILSNAEYLATGEKADQAETVKRNALEIRDLSEKIRLVLDSFEQGRKGQQPVSLTIILEEKIEMLREDYPETTVAADLPERTMYVDSTLDDVLWNVLQNAAKHNTNPEPTVRVNATVEGDSVVIAVTDNGPGINDEELAILNEGTETPLEHGSGIGLAFIVWGTEIVGGTVTFGDNDPSGTTVTIEVPATPEPRKD